MPTRLYYSPGSCSLAVNIALKEIGIPHDMARFATAERANFTPAYLAVNPKARIPALEIDGFTLTEAAAILIYLGRRFPQAGLYPREPGEVEARIVEWLLWCSNTVHPTFAMIRRTERYASDTTVHPAIRAHGHVLYKKAMADIDAHYAKHDWVAGNTMSVADTYSFVLYRWAKMEKYEMERDCPAFTRTFDRMAARPAVVAALAAESSTARP